MNRETLRVLGLTEEQIEAIIADHGRIVQGVQARLSAAENRATDLENQLDQASNSEEIQTLTARAETAENQVTELQAQVNQMTINDIVNEALTQAGATDLDYARYKLGELELNEDGTIKDLDNKVKDLQTNFPAQFEQSTDPKNPEGNPKDPLDGFKRVDNDLKNGKQTDPDATQQMIDAFTSDIPQTTN